VGGINACRMQFENFGDVPMDPIPLFRQSGTKTTQCRHCEKEGGEKKQRRKTYDGWSKREKTAKLFLSRLTISRKKKERWFSALEKKKRKEDGSASSPIRRLPKIEGRHECLGPSHPKFEGKSRVAHVKFIDRSGKGEKRKKEGGRGRALSHLRSTGGKRDCLRTYAREKV